MMNFKVFTAFFLTLLAVHASTQTPLEDSTKPVVAAFLETGLEGVSVFLKAAHKYVNDFDKHEESVRAQILDYAVKVAYKLYHVVLSLMDDLKGDVTTDGRTVIECIEAGQGTTQVAIKKFAKSVGNCLGDEVHVALYQVNVLLKTLDGIYADAKESVDKYRECSSSDTTCLKELAQGAIRVSEKNKPIVKKNISVLNELVQIILQDVSMCRLDKAAKSGALDIFNEYVGCLKH